MAVYRDAVAEIIPLVEQSADEAPCRTFELVCSAAWEALRRNKDSTMETTTNPAAIMPVVTDLQQLASLVKHRGTLHVRFSDGPEEDARRESIDAESGLVMPGLSAYALTPPDWWKRPLEDWLARQLCQYVDLTTDDRRAWLLTGTEMGEGPDREALLGHVRPTGWIADELLLEARERYEERFGAR